ncbi:MAG: tetratricopeptide (TPR) repeat protein [Candidatus Azotimanducaceae bacterium]|jgi:tetratricopeptide (TPR) repeat protein
MKGYSTREVAELLALSPRVVREIARGVIDAERDDKARYQFSFQDIVLLRTAKELISGGVPQGKINRTLLSLQRRLPADRSLTSLRITGDSGAVVIRELDQVYNPESGQLHFNFAIAELAGSVAPLARRAAAEAATSDNLTSDDWFDVGVDLEAVSPEEAPAAYLRALELDPEYADAHVNLGRLMQESGDFTAAEDHYSHALLLEPDHALAAFNFGTLLEDMGRIEQAIEVYQQATAFADAHYNLSRLFELLGRHEQALAHLKTYRQLIDSGA